MNVIVRRVDASFADVNVRNLAKINHVLTSVNLESSRATPRSLAVILNRWFLVGVRSRDIWTSTISPTRIAHGETGLNLSSVNCKLAISEFSFWFVTY